MNNSYIEEDLNMNYRLEGLQREADNVAKYLKKEVGLLGCDLEIMGALLFLKYKGEDNKIDELLKHSAKLREEAQQLIDRLKNKQ